MAAARPALERPLTLADLRRALEEKERALRDLLARKERLAGELEELGGLLEAMLAGGAAAPVRTEGKGRARGGATRRGARGPAKAAAVRAGRGAPREGSLPAFIRAALEQVVGPLRIAEIVEAVQAAGYTSRSAKLNVIVANRLSQMDDVEKVERGLYQLRRDPAGAAADPDGGGGG